MSGERAKRHHHVPQFYLRGFALNDRICTVELPGDRRYAQSVRRTAAENAFYSVPGHPDGDDAFEKVLGVLESDAARVFAAIEGGQWPLAPDDRAVLADFISVQAARGPEQRWSMDQLAAQWIRLEVGHGGRANVGAWAKRRWGVELTDADADTLWEQATQPGGPPIRHAPIAHIQQMVEVSRELQRIVSARPWSLIRFSRRALVTSDRPVALIARETDEPWMGVGFLTAQAILYPLTRRIGLIMGDATPMIERNIDSDLVRQGAFDLSHEGTTAVEKEFNAAIVGNASLYVYHHPEDARFLPEPLPDPRPVAMTMSGGDQEFSGEPTFGPPGTPD